MTVAGIVAALSLLAVAAAFVVTVGVLTKPRSYRSASTPKEGKQ